MSTLSILQRSSHHFIAALLVASAMSLAAAPAGAHDDTVDPATATRLDRLTDQLIAAIGAFRQSDATARDAAVARLKSLARERRAAMLAAIERHPGLTQRRALPNGLTMGLPTDIRALLEEEVKVTAHVGVAIGDDPRGRSASRRYFVEVTSGPYAGRYRLHAADRPDHGGHDHPAAAYVGQEVTLRALKLDGQLLFADDGSIAPTNATNTTTPLQGAISGSQSTLVLLGNFKDKALDSYCTPSYVNSTVFGASNSVNDLYRQSTNGAVTFSGATYGPFQMASSASTSDFWAVGDEMDRLAAAQGIDARSYGKTVYVVPQVSSGYIGVALISVGSAGSFYRAWIMACNQPDVYAHEIGHLLGLGHSGTPGNEYGDMSDIMGRSALPLRQFAAPKRAIGGWFPASKVQNVLGSGTFTLDPTALSNPANAQTLVVPKPDTNESYFISFRQAIGYDSGLSSAYLNRVSIHSAALSPSNANSTLLATLGAGESYSDPVNGYQFTVNGIGSTATVGVSMAAAACVRAAPTVSVAPSSQSGAPGSAIGYLVTVRNNSNSGCGTAAFGFSSQLPNGWSASVAPANLSLEPGQAATVNWTVTSPTSNIAQQAYAVGLTASDAASPSSAASGQASYIVTVADATPPAVAITSPAGGGSVSGSVTVTVNATDNVGVAKVELWIDGALKQVDTSYPYSFSWNTRKLSGSHTIGARAFDAAGNVTTATPISVTVSASGSKRPR
jgi:hypothetical protein